MNILSSLNHHLPSRKHTHLPKQSFLEHLFSSFLTFHFHSTVLFKYSRTEPKRKEQVFLPSLSNSFTHCHWIGKNRSISHSISHSFSFKMIYVYKRGMYLLNMIVIVINAWMINHRVRIASSCYMVPFWTNTDTSCQFFPFLSLYRWTQGGRQIWQGHRTRFKALLRSRRKLCWPNWNHQKGYRWYLWWCHNGRTWQFGRRNCCIQDYNPSWLCRFGRSYCDQQSAQGNT